MTAELIDVLACPRCDKPLDLDDSTLRCAGCDVDFPRVGNVPWLFSEPGFSIAEWRQRLDFLLRRLEDDAARIDKTLAARQDLLPLTRERLERLKEAVTDHGRRLGELLAPLAADEPRASFTTYLALRTRLPPDQGLTTYYPNLHRDWCWGDEENEATFKLLAPKLDGLGSDANVLVLGSGAGRLAYDLHMSRAGGMTVALDFNPLFQLAAARIVTGETLALYEFPLAPRTLADHALLRELGAPAPARPGFHAVLGDALRAPFREAAFDVVVTPWLIDILPEDFATLCPRINHLLVKSGRWLNLGSLMFNQASPDRQYSPEECAALVEVAGFATPGFEEATIPYMTSPASRHGRRETVLAWRADKTGRAKRPGRHEALPDWLVRGSEPVPALDAFRVQFTTTRIHAALMSLIDGRRSIKDMAQVLVEQRLMAPSDAEPAIREFLMKMYSDSQRAQRL